MNKYEYLDKRIVAEIGRQANTAALLYADAVLKLMLNDHRTNRYDLALRVLDRRLQALRKRGVIRFDTGLRVWRVV